MDDHIGWRSRGCLPHLDGSGLVQHIVFRLSDSLPAAALGGIRSRDAAGQAQAIDAALDRGFGRRDLAIPELGALVERALLRFDGKRYALLAWCVMLNHVHALIETRPSQRLDRVIHSWKSYTATQANRLVHRTGAFWAAEYFDRFMRDDAHLVATRAYMEGNPVKAGLCQRPSDWRFSSASRR
jgi:putative transposase